MAGKYFVGLGADEPAPDHTSLTTFKERIIDAVGIKGYEAVFNELLRVAMDKGVSFGQIHTVDSVHTIANVNLPKDKLRQEKKGKPPRDPDARWGVKKVKDSFYGYKTHVSRDTDSGFVTAITVTGGQAADGNEFQPLVNKDRKLGIVTDGAAYTADKAYKGKYVYYHCTQYNGKHSTKWLREEDLTKQLSDVFRGLQMPREVVEDITQSLREAHKDKSHFHRSILDGYQAEYQKYEKRIEKMYEDKLDGRITDDYYDQKRQEYRAKQKELQDKMTKLYYADEEYYIIADYLLQLASRAYELFESSEVQEKRQLLKLTLQNLKLERNLVRYDLLKPFDKKALFASRQQWLKTWDSYRKVDWVNEIEYPELTYQETQRFLSAKFLNG